MTCHGWGHVELLRLVAACLFEGLEFGVQGGLPLPPCLHPVDSDVGRMIGEQDVPVQDERLVGGECVGKLLHV